MREWTIVSGMEARACCVCLAWASFGLRDVHVKTNGCFFSLSVQHDCHPRFHVCISCRSQRKHARHIASVRDMLHIESSRRFWRVCVNTCRAHMRIRALASAGRVHVKLDRRFRHVCPFSVYRLPRKCCTCQIRPSFSTCTSGHSRGNPLHVKSGHHFRHARPMQWCEVGVHTVPDIRSRCS